MEIVKQRKRRLLAWILVMALGICMWQSNVLATEGIGDGNPAEPESVSDNTLENGNEGTDGENPDNPAPDTKQGDDTNVMQIKVVLRAKDSDGNIKGNCAFKVSEKEQKISVTEDGIAEVILDVSDFSRSNSLNKAFLEIKTDIPDTVEREVVHNVISWEYSAMSDDGNTETKNVDGNTLNNLQEVANKSKGEITAILGKTAIIYFWEGIDASGNPNNIIDIKTVSQQSEEENWEISFEKCENNGEGAFFVGWKDYDEDKIYENSYQGTYEGFETEKNFIGSYSKEINSMGSFFLKKGTQYELKAGTYQVEGYTYQVGDDNLFFYVAEDKEYSFE